MNVLRSLLFLSALTACAPLSLLAGCASSSAGGSGGTPDSGDSGGANDASTQDGASPDASAGDAGDAGASVGGSASLIGTYGTQPIAPVMAAYWIGKPDNASESGGGPFVYIFSGAVTCDDLSHGSGWIARIPAGTQMLELIIGTTTTGTAVPAAAHAAAGAAEINYAIAPSGTESRATTGNVTLSSYTAGDSVDGTVTATFPMGSVTGTFHAVYCANGNEL